jgi:hypothetical protein
MYYGDSFYSSNIKEIIPIKKSRSLIENEFYILECKDKNKRSMNDIDSDMEDVSMPQSSLSNSDMMDIDTYKSNASSTLDSQ